MDAQAVSSFVPIMSLWLPIIFSAAIVFLVSALFHMVLPHHKNDYGKLPSEDAARAAIGGNVPPGEYVVPYAASNAERATEEFTKKMNDGPVVFMTFRAPGPVGMGKELGIWFVYCLLVGIFVAYIAGRALEPGAHYLSVFRFVGATAFFCYTVGLWQDSIWFGRPWGTTFKNTVDGLVYALLTAGTFGWLWPEM